MSFENRHRIEQLILQLVAARGPAKSVCPSEIARRLDPTDWRSRMPAVRTAAFSLAVDGRVEVAQRGVALDPAAPIRGAIRLRMPQVRG